MGIFRFWYFLGLEGSGIELRTLDLVVWAIGLMTLHLQTFLRNVWPFLGSLVLDQWYWTDALCLIKGWAVFVGKIWFWLTDIFTLSAFFGGCEARGGGWTRDPWFEKRSITCLCPTFQGGSRTPLNGMREGLSVSGNPLTARMEATQFSCKY